MLNSFLNNLKTDQMVFLIQLNFFPLLMSCFLSSHLFPGLACSLLPFLLTRLSSSSSDLIFSLFLSSFSVSCSCSPWLWLGYFFFSTYSASKGWEKHRPDYRVGSGTACCSLGRAVVTLPCRIQLPFLLENLGPEHTNASLLEACKLASVRWIFTGRASQVKQVML